MKKSTILVMLSILIFMAAFAALFDLHFTGIALASPAEQEWPMFRHDLAHTGYSNSTAPDTNSTIWTYGTGGEVYSSPSVADGKVYVGSGDANVYCLNASNGASIWNYTTDGGVYSSPAVVDGRVYIGSDDSRVYCLDASTGICIWNYTTGNYVESSPMVTDGKVYIGSCDGYVYCLNASDGTWIWNCLTSGWVFSSPALADDRVYVGSDSSGTGYAYFYCLNASTGGVIWSRLSYSDVWSSPAVAGDKVYIGINYNVCCLNASDGSVIWSYAMGSDSSPAIYDERVYVGTWDNNVCCLNASDGTSIWNYTTGSGLWSSPAVADGKVYVGSYEGKVYCLDASDGAEIWSYSMDGYVNSSPAVADGRIYIGSDDYKVYAFEDVYNLTITAGYGGTTDPAPGTYGYVEKTTVTVTATPSEGYGFDHWELDGYSNYSNPIVITMEADHTLNAVFYYNVTIEAYCASEGSDVAVDIAVDGTPTGYSTPHNFTMAGGTHNLTVPDLDSKGHFFKQWSTAENSTTIVVSSAGTYTAYYQARYNLTITTTTGGTTNPEPGDYTHWDGTMVDVNANPSLGYVLGHWELDTVDVGDSNPITVTMNRTHTLEAVFSWAGTYNLTITSTAGGTTEPIPGTYTYTNGTSVNITALQEEGFDFDHWELDGSWNYSNPIIVTMDSGHSLHAVFTYGVMIEAYCYKEDAGVNVNVTMDGSPTGYATPQMFNVTGTHNYTVPDVDSSGHFFKQWSTGENSTTITVTSAGTYTAYYQARYNLTITATTGGTTEPPPGDYSYWNGTAVYVTAYSTLGYQFDHWNLDSSNIGSENPVTIIMDSDYTLNAVFKILYTLEIEAVEHGTTEPLAGVYNYTDGTVVQVTAIPATDCGFDHWELDASWVYFNPINVTMDSNHTLQPAFSHNVTIEAFDVTENVTVSVDIEIDGLPTNYTTPYTFTIVGTHNFTVPDMDLYGNFFEQWSTGETNTTITISSPPTVTAKYKKQCKLTIEAASGGTTSPLPGKHQYWHEDEAEVTALPTLGYVFDHWELDSSNVGSENPIFVTMDTDHTLQPFFSWVGTYNLTITTTTGGTTNPTPGSHEYTNGTSAEVTATPDAGYQLCHWELDSSNVGHQNPITVTMDSDHTLHAVFKAICTLTIMTAPGGTTNPQPGSVPYCEGEVAGVTAIPSTGYDFGHWELDGSWNYSNPIFVVMDANHTLYVVFTYNVTIKAHCSSEGIDVNVNITMDGSPTGYTTPHTFALTGTHNFTVPEADPRGDPFYLWVLEGMSWQENRNVTIGKSGNYTAYYWTPTGGGPRVGGRYYLIDKIALLAPYIGLTLTILVATVATANYVKHLRRKEEK